MSDDFNDSVDIDDPSYVIADPAIYHAFPTRSHFVAMKIALERKVKELETYKTTGSMGNTHLNWIAGNRDDPEFPMTTVERALQDKFDEIVSKACRQTRKSYNLDWAKTSYIGMRLDGDPKREPKHHVEIQLKRISGADKFLLKACGVDPNVVFATLTKKFDYDGIFDPMVK